MRGIQMSQIKYINHDPEILEPFFSQHMSAMTEQKLHNKADIAIQLAWLDQQVHILELAQDRHMCRWSLDSDGYYDTGCGHAYTTIEGNLKDNDCNFCPFCGGGIKETNKDG